MAVRFLLVWERSDKPIGGGGLVADNFCLIDIQKRTESIGEKIYFNNGCKIKNWKNCRYQLEFKEFIDFEGKPKSYAFWIGSKGS